MATCDLTDPQLLEVYDKVRGAAPENWLLMGYGETRNKLSITASGAGGVDEMRAKLEGPVSFGYVKLADDYVIVVFVDPASATSLQKAKASVHKRAVAGHFVYHHAILSIDNKDDLTTAKLDEAVRTTDVPRPEGDPRGGSTGAKPPAAASADDAADSVSARLAARRAARMAGRGDDSAASEPAVAGDEERAGRERKAKEEAERNDAERKAKEEAERNDAERKAKEEAERDNAERKVKEDQEAERKRTEAASTSQEDEEREAKAKADAEATERTRRRAAAREAAAAEAARKAKAEEEEAAAAAAAAAAERKAKQEEEEAAAARKAKEEADAAAAAAAAPHEETPADVEAYRNKRRLEREHERGSQRELVSPTTAVPAAAPAATAKPKASSSGGDDDLDLDGLTEEELKELMEDLGVDDKPAVVKADPKLVSTGAVIVNDPTLKDEAKREQTEQIEKIIKQLETNDPHCVRINLNNAEYFTEDQQVRLGNALSKHEHVIEFAAANAVIHERGAIAIAKGLSGNKSIGIVNLESNFLGSGGLEALADMLLVNTAVKEMLLNNQRTVIAAKSETKLAASLEKNTTLQKLGYVCRDIQARQKIDKMIFRNKDLARQARVAAGKKK